MPYTIEYDPEAGLVASRVQGVVDLEEIKVFARAAAKVLKENNCRLLLNDFREVTLALSTMDIHGLPQLFETLLSAEGIERYSVKRALVTTADQSDYTFFETVSVNRAHNVKLFHDIEEARAWLLSK